MNQIKLSLILKAIDEKKGEDIVNFDVNTTSPFFTNVIVVTAMNKKHAEAIADEVDKVCASLNEPIKNIEGKNGSDWVLVDAGDMLVHIFTEQERVRINIEQLIKKSVQEG